MGGYEELYIALMVNRLWPYTQMNYVLMGSIVFLPFRTWMHTPNGSSMPTGERNFWIASLHRSPLLILGKKNLLGHFKRAAFQCKLSSSVRTPIQTMWITTKSWFPISLFGNWAMKIICLKT